MSATTTHGAAAAAALAIAAAGCLAPPAELQTDVDELLAQARRATDRVESQGPEAFFGTDDDPFEGVNAQARAIGLEACAS